MLKLGYTFWVVTPSISHSTIIPASFTISSSEMPAIDADVVIVASPVTILSYWKSVIV
jgi:hypothetical protein